MAASIAKLAILLTTDTTGMTRGFQRAQLVLGNFKSGVDTSSISMGRLGAGLSLSSVAMAGMAAAAVAATAAVYKLGEASLRLAANAEVATAQFEVMLGSAKQAKGLMKDLRGLAATTPFGTADLQDASRTLLQFGVDGESILPTLEMLGDASGGNAQRLQQMALAYGQVQSTGRLMGQDLLQMINAGFNPLKEISDKTGVSMAELKKKMEAGAISAEAVTAAFQSATSEGGRYHGMSNKMAETLPGMWSTLKDDLAEIGTILGERLLEPAKGVVSSASSAVQSFKKWIDPTSSAAKNIEKAALSSEEMNKAFASITDNTAELEKKTEKLRQHAESLTESLRTPLEVLRDSAKEANELLDAGLITVETWGRAIEKFGDTYRDAVKKPPAIPQLETPAVSAAERFTMSGFSAVQAGKADMQRQLDLQAQQLAAQKANNRLTEEILRETQRNRPAQPKVVTSL